MTEDLQKSLDFERAKNEVLVQQVVELEDELDGEDEVAKPMWRNLVH